MIGASKCKKRGRAYLTHLNDNVDCLGSSTIFAGGMPKGGPFLGFLGGFVGQPFTDKKALSVSPSRLPFTLPFSGLHAKREKVKSGPGQCVVKHTEALPAFGCNARKLRQRRRDALQGDPEYRRDQPVRPVGALQVASNSENRLCDKYFGSLTLLRRVPCSTKEEMEACVEISVKAQQSWREVPVQQRARVLAKLVTLLNQHKAELANVIVRENGKTYIDAEGDVARGIEVVEHACAMPTLMMGETAEQVVCPQPTTPSSAHLHTRFARPSPPPSSSGAPTPPASVDGVSALPDVCPSFPRSRASESILLYPSARTQITHARVSQSRPKPAQGA